MENTWDKQALSGAFCVAFCLFFSIGTADAQRLSVEYLVKENRNNALTSLETSYILAISGHESVYFNPRADASQFRHQSAISEDRSAEGGMVRFADNVSYKVKKEVVYKNYLADSLIFNDLLLNKDVVVYEPIMLFDWQPSHQADSVILGYRCQRATATFRGRQYEAFFSPELSAFGGPWKFDGLPGLILSVRSLDNYFVIIPLAITLNDRTHQVAHPYTKTAEILTWKQFTTRFEERLDKVLRLMKSKSEPGETGSIKISDRIEDLGIEEKKIR